MRVIKNGFIPTAGHEPHQDLVACPDGLAVHLDIAGRCAPKVERGRGQPDEFIRAGVPDSAGLQLPQKLWLLRQQPQRHSNRISRSVISSGDQKAKEILEILPLHRPVTRPQDPCKNPRIINRRGPGQHTLCIVIQFDPRR